MAASARPRTPRALAALAASMLLLGGCGEDAGSEPASSSSRDQLVVPEPSLSSELALAGRAGSLDPLFAASRTERLISRQIHEPLVAALRAPFAPTVLREGPGRVLPPTGRQTKWRVRLRPGVRFQDGSPLDAAAVRANFDRWVSSGVAERELPAVAAVDSPQPDIVRFQFAAPTPDFPALIADPRLGLVSPVAIAEAAGGRVRGLQTGAGPYELRERQGERVLLGRNPGWWGSAAGLGPGVGRLEFRLGAGPRARAGQLESGAVQIAASLDPVGARRVARNPLLTVHARGGRATGAERSVRGVEGLSVRQSLSELWLTDLP